jgi:hypothetical protein
VTRLFFAQNRLPLSFYRVGATPFAPPESTYGGRFCLKSGASTSAPYRNKLAASETEMALRRPPAFRGFALACGLYSSP